MIDLQTTNPPTVAPIIQSVYAKRLSDGKLFKIDLEKKLYNRFILRPVSFCQWEFITAPTWRLRDPKQYKLFAFFGA
jgi:hypothetical protein